MALDIDPGLVSGDPFYLFKNTRQFEFETGGTTFDVYEFHLREKLFDTFRAELTIVHSRYIQENEFLGKSAKVKLIGRSSERVLHGMVCEYRELSSRRDYYLYKVVVVSDLWPMTRIRNLRIFQDMTIPGIIEEVLADSRISKGSYDVRLITKFPVREYCVQYRESNMEFLKRIMAEAGIFFYHEYRDDRTVPVITDDQMWHKKIPGSTGVVIYSKKGQLVNFEDHITEFEIAERLTAENVILTDYILTNPFYPRFAKSKTKEERTFYSIYDYPGYLEDERSAYRRADMRLQQETWKSRTFHGKGVCRTLVPGHLFTLEDHPKRDLDGDYIVTSVVHEGKQPQVLKELGESKEGTTYGNTFTCIPKGVTYRPAPRKKPSVRGLQSAIVTGPPDEEIYTDEYGRIKVKFHWDRLGKEERTSCWVRVSQIWAGSGKGCESIFTPRIGHEVLVDFLDGDPDRPVVVGTVFNYNSGPPYNLPMHKTRSTIKTHTVKGKGFNELRFEDMKDAEEIYIHAQKDMNSEILNDRTASVGHDDKTDIKNDRTKTVGHDQKEEVGNDKSVKVGKNHAENIGENMAVTVGKNLDETSGENKTVSVGKDLSETVGGDASVSIKKSLTHSVSESESRETGENFAVTSGKDSSFKSGGQYAITSDKGVDVTAAKKIIIEADGGIILKCGSGSITLKDNGDIILDGNVVQVKGSSDVIIKGSKVAGN
jgi:type VI secretion system secreted protein VgrG